MGKGRPQKYNRISCQQKYMLRRLITKEKMSVKQAAQTLGINYSTAKTIMFFYRKTTSPSLSISPSLSNSSLNRATAIYTEISPMKKIQILSSVGSGNWMKLDDDLPESTDSSSDAWQDFYSPHPNHLKNDFSRIFEQEQDNYNHIIQDLSHKCLIQNMRNAFLFQDIPNSKNIWMKQIFRYYILRWHLIPRKSKFIEKCSIITQFQSHILPYLGIILNQNLQLIEQYIIIIYYIQHLSLKSFDLMVVQFIFEYFFLNSLFHQKINRGFNWLLNSCIQFSQYQIVQLLNFREINNLNFNMAINSINQMFFVHGTCLKQLNTKTMLNDFSFSYHSHLSVQFEASCFFYWVFLLLLHWQRILPVLQDFPLSNIFVKSKKMSFVHKQDNTGVSLDLQLDIRSVHKVFQSLEIDHDNYFQSAGNVA